MRIAATCRIGLFPLSSSLLHWVFTHGFVRDSSSARCVNVRAAAQASVSLTLYTILCGPRRTKGGPSPVTRHRCAVRRDRRYLWQNCCSVRYVSSRPRGLVFVLSE